MNRQVIFVAASDFLYFRECVANALRRYECQLHAYVLMSNHVHLLLTPNDGALLGRAMQSIGRRYVRYFNVVHRRSGPLWEGRYRAAHVDSERHLMSCYRYIEQNPVRAGMCTEPASYHWTSHRANAYGDPDPLVAWHPSYVALGADDDARRRAYRALFDAPVSADTLRAIRAATHDGLPTSGALTRVGLAATLAAAAG